MPAFTGAAGEEAERNSPCPETMMDFGRQSVLKLLRAVIAHFLEPMVTCSDFDDDGQIAPRPHGQGDLGKLHAEHGGEILVQPQPIVVLVVVP